MNIGRFAGCSLVILVVLSLLTGCWDDERIDHKPPAGQGAVVIDNRTANDLNVFINGTQMDRVTSFRWRAYDLPPGVHRVVLGERDSFRNWRGDVDVLEKRLTILDTTIDPIRPDELSVFVYFD